MLWRVLHFTKLCLYFKTQENPKCVSWPAGSMFSISVNYIVTILHAKIIIKQKFFKKTVCWLSFFSKYDMIYPKYDWICFKFYVMTPQESKNGQSKWLLLNYCSVWFIQSSIKGSFSSSGHCDAAMAKWFEIALSFIKKDHQRMMVDPIFMIV